MNAKTSHLSAGPARSKRQSRIPAIRSRRSLVLVIDDDPETREIIKDFLETKASVRVIEAMSSEVALRLAMRRKFDLVISDIARPGMDGLEFLQVFKKAHPNIPVIIASGVLDDARIKLARHLGAFYCLPKQSLEAKLLAVVREALRTEED